MRAGILGLALCLAACGDDDAGSPKDTRVADTQVAADTGDVVVDTHLDTTADTDVLADTRLDTAVAPDTAADTVVAVDSVGGDTTVADDTAADTTHTDTTVADTTPADTVASDTDTTADTTVPPGTARLVVHSRDARGMPIPSARVEVGQRVAVGSASGTTTLSDMPAGHVNIEVSADDYAEAWVDAQLESDATRTVVVTLARLGPPLALSRDDNTTIHVDGLAVTFYPHSVNAPGGGTLASAAARVARLNLAETGLAAAPAALVGPPAGGGNPEPIDVIAAFNVTLQGTSDAGASVDAVLTNAIGAGVEVVLPPELQAKFTSGASVPAWSFDPTAGEWSVGVQGTIQPSTGDDKLLAWVGHVPHFSWWVIGGVLTETACLSVHVRAADDHDPLVASVRVIGDTPYGATRTFTNTAGDACVAVAKGGTVQVVASNGQYPHQVGGPKTVTVGGDGASCVSPVNGGSDCDTVTLDLAGTHCVQGKVVNESGVGVAGAVVAGTSGAGAGVTGAGAVSDAQGEYCLPLTISAQSTVGVVDPADHRVVLSYATVTTGAQASCVDGLCTAVDPLSIDVLDPEVDENGTQPSCYTGELYRDFSVFFTDDVGLIWPGFPIYLYSAYPDPDLCSEGTGPAQWGPLRGQATAGAGGRFCLLATGADSRPEEPDALLFGDCGERFWHRSCAMEDPGEGDFVPPTNSPAGWVLGACGQPACYSLGTRVFSCPAF